MTDAVAFSRSEPDDRSGLVGAYGALRPQLLRFLRARTGDAALAEDILQDMWLRLSGQGSGPVGNPSAYLHRMAANMVIDHARSERQRGRRDRDWTELQVDLGGTEAADETPDAERNVLGRDELSRILQTIAAMPPRASEAFRLHRIEGLSHSEVASRLGVSRSAVEKNMATAIKFLIKSISG